MDMGGAFEEVGSGERAGGQAGGWTGSRARQGGPAGRELSERVNEAGRQVPGRSVDLQVS